MSSTRPLSRRLVRFVVAPLALGAVFTVAAPVAAFALPPTPNVNVPSVPPLPDICTGFHDATAAYKALAPLAGPLDRCIDPAV